MPIDSLSSNSISNDDQLVEGSSFFKIHDSDNSDQITFINYTSSYCICIIDIVNSTRVTKELTNSKKIRRYYSIFLNTMASIIKQYDGKVIKNAGDCLICYFPRTVHLVNESAFENVIECGLAMVQANSTLNEKLHENGLPLISYRISANYGKVELATSSNSNGVDLFGPTVNICSKINPLSLPNQMVIYEDLYDAIKKTSFFNQYNFIEVIKKEPDDTYCGYRYKVYSVSSSYKPIGHQYLTPNEIIYPKNHRIRKKQNQNKQNKTNSFNILLIDDDEDILHIFSNILKREGYNTISYSHPIEAWTHFSKVSPYYFDLILTDIRMPGINGVKLYFKFKTINPDIKYFLSLHLMQQKNY